MIIFPILHSLRLLSPPLKIRKVRVWENRRHFIRHTQISGRVPKIASSIKMHSPDVFTPKVMYSVGHPCPSSTYSGITMWKCCFWNKKNLKVKLIMDHIEKKFWNSGVYVIFWRLYPLHIKNFLEIDLYILTTTCASICSVLHWIPICLFRFNIGSPPTFRLYDSCMPTCWGCLLFCYFSF